MLVSVSRAVVVGSLMGGRRCIFCSRKARLRGRLLKTWEVREVLVQKLRQDIPGQLGMIARRMSDAGINIEVVYSDHANQLCLVVDDFAKGKAVSDAWKSEMWPDEAVTF